LKAACLVAAAVPLAAIFKIKNNRLLTVVADRFKSKGGSGTGLVEDRCDGADAWNHLRTESSEALLR